MSSTFIILLFVSGVAYWPIIVYTQQTDAEKAFYLLRLKDSSVQPAAVASEVIYDAPAIVPPNTAAETLAHSSPEYAPETSAASGTLNGLLKARPLKLVYEEIPIGSTPDPNAPEIGPDGKKIRQQNWGGETPPLQLATKEAPAKKSEPNFIFHVAKLGQAVAVPAPENPNFSVLPGATISKESGISDVSTGGEATKAKTTDSGNKTDDSGNNTDTGGGLGQKIVRNGKTKGQGTWPHQEPEVQDEECIYIGFGFIPCGFNGYFFPRPFPYPYGYQYYNRNYNYPYGYQYYNGNYDYPYVAPYAHWPIAYTSSE
jgi:hypothetical protein